MSRIRKSYENSFRARFRRYITGQDELPEKDYMPLFDEQIKKEKEADEKATEHYLIPPIADPKEDAKRYAEMSGIRRFRHLYRVMAVLLCLGICGILIYNAICMPRFGSADTPMNNEVPKRYVEEGLEETGAVNIVTGVILQYRGFDTFGETYVLFLATIAVMILLKKGKNEEPVSTIGEHPRSDRILRMMARVMVPLILLFGLYVLVNGHLSPGGGFSGGAILGAGLILYSASFGFEATSRFFNERIYDIIKVGSLALYSLLMIYYLFTGANGIRSIVPLGKAGAILSSGLILPINILVGLEVACTMYAFFALFRKGGL